MTTHHLHQNVRNLIFITNSKPFILLYSFILYFIIIIAIAWNVGEDFYHFITQNVHI